MRTSCGYKGTAKLNGFQIKEMESQNRNQLIAVLSREARKFGKSGDSIDIEIITGDGIKLEYHELIRRICRKTKYCIPMEERSIVYKAKWTSSAHDRWSSFYYDEDFIRLRQTIVNAAKYCTKIGEEVTYHIYAQGGTPRVYTFTRK
jgi:hypothetical protein